MDPKQFLRTIVRWWWLFILVVLTTFGATAYLTIQQIPVYAARATYVTKLSAGITDSSAITSALASLNRENDIITTYSEVAMSQMIESRAEERLNLSPEDEAGLSVRSRVIPGTTILEITVEGNSPTLVRDFANAVGAETAAYSNSLYASYRLEQLDPAQAPGEPIRPRLTLNLIAGGLLSFFLGVSAVVASAWISGALHSGAHKPTNNQVTTPVLKELGEIKKQTAVVRKELYDSGLLIHNSRVEAKTLLDTINKVKSELNGQKRR